MDYKLDKLFYKFLRNIIFQQLQRHRKNVQFGYTLSTMELSNIGQRILSYLVIIY